jgi:hypothetical protein
MYASLDGPVSVLANFWLKFNEAFFSFGQCVTQLVPESDRKSTT